MIRLLLLFTLAVSLQAATHRQATYHRSRETTRRFQQLHPCPSTGKRTGGCPGYVKDHRVPLACSGADLPYNLQWQSTADAKAKDKVERKGCR